MHASDGAMIFDFAETGFMVCDLCGRWGVAGTLQAMQKHPVAKFHLDEAKAGRGKSCCGGRKPSLNVPDAGEVVLTSESSRIAHEP